MAGLPLLLPNDPRNLLSATQRRYVYEAMDTANLLESRALREIELLNAARDGAKALDVSPGSGPAYLKHRLAVLEGVRIVAVAEMRAFRGAGIFGRQLRHIVDEHILDSLEGSYDLSTIERDVLRQEMQILREEYRFPEWLCIPKESADPKLSPLCQLSAEALSRLEVVRNQTESYVERQQPPAQTHDKVNNRAAGFDGDIHRFASELVLRYVESFAPPLLREWQTAQAGECLSDSRKSSLSTAILQLASEYVLVTHKLYRIKDWDSVCERANEAVAAMMSAEYHVEADYAEHRSVSPWPAGSVAKVGITKSTMENCGRRAAVESYIAEVREKTGRVITKKDIWTVAQYKDRSEFERWERCDKRTGKHANATFTRILREKPHLKG